MKMFLVFCSKRQSSGHLLLRTHVLENVFYSKTPWFLSITSKVECYVVFNSRAIENTYHHNLTNYQLSVKVILNCLSFALLRSGVGRGTSRVTSQLKADV